MQITNKPGIFLAQYLPQFNGDLMAAARAMADIGYKYVQLPPVFDVGAAAESTEWCQDNLIGPLGEMGLGISEISFHIPGQAIAVHPAYLQQYAQMAGIENAKLEDLYFWGLDNTKKIIKASANMGLGTAVGFTGSFLWPFVYPWPQRPAGLVEMAFEELARRWKPILEFADNLGVNLAFELHPGEDVHDGRSFDRFQSNLDSLRLPQEVCRRAGINYDPSHFLLQGLDYLDFINDYGELIYAYHVKDAELDPDGGSGVYGGFQEWKYRAGKFRTPGTGHVDFFGIQQMLGDHLVGVVEWEDPDQDAMQGACWAYELLTTGRLPDEDVIETTMAFDDFAAAGESDDFNRALLGLDQFSVLS